MFAKILVKVVILFVYSQKFLYLCSGFEISVSGLVVSG